MQKKYYIIIIVILVVLNIFSWRIWWEAPRGREVTPPESIERDRGARGNDGMGFFENRLKLTPEQKQEFSELKKSYFVEVEEVKDSMSLVRKQLVFGIGNDMDEDTRSTLFGQMAKFKLEIERTTIQHFNNMRHLCSEEQKPMFDTIMVRMMEHSPMFKESGRKQGKHRRSEGRGRRK